MVIKRLLFNAGKVIYVPHPHRSDETHTGCDVAEDQSASNLPSTTWSSPIILDRTVLAAFTLSSPPLDAV